MEVLQLPMQGQIQSLERGVHFAKKLKSKKKKKVTAIMVALHQMLMYLYKDPYL